MISFIVSIRNIVLVISLCILERGNTIWYIRTSEIVAGLHDDITSGRVFCNLFAILARY